MKPETATARLPGDKSISHRALLVAALAPGVSRLRGLSPGLDVRSTADGLVLLGAEVSRPDGDTVYVAPPAAWRDGQRIDCGNSGTTARLLAGLLAGLGVDVVLDGDESLRSRPMDRVVYPLQAMGARIDYLEERDRLPVRLRARSTGELRVLRYRARRASAQVKSSLTLAALAAGVEFEMWEPQRTRDHTERLLAELGVAITYGPEGEGGHLHLPAAALRDLTAVDLDVPGDPSAAAFLLCAGLLGRRPVEVADVLLSGTRTRYLELLERFGAEVEIRTDRSAGGEEVGGILVRPRTLTAVEIGPSDVPGLIDELPALAVLAARAEGTTTIRGAGELRVKESDRIAAVARGLGAVGFAASELPDGLRIEGRPGHIPSGRVTTHGDHRIAMAFGMLRAIEGADVRVDDPDCVAVSYPDFWRDLERGLT